MSLHGSRTFSARNEVIYFEDTIVYGVILTHRWQTFTSALYWMVIQKIWNRASFLVDFYLSLDKYKSRLSKNWNKQFDTVSLGPVTNTLRLENNMSRTTIWMVTVLPTRQIRKESRCLIIVTDSTWGFLVPTNGEPNRMKWWMCKDSLRTLMCRKFRRETLVNDFIKRTSSQKNLVK